MRNERKLRIPAIAGITVALLGLLVAPSAVAADDPEADRLKPPCRRDG